MAVLGLLTIAALARADGGAAAADTAAVRFTTSSEGDVTVIAGENTSPWIPYHGVAEFPRLENLNPSVPVPARFVIPPATKMEVLRLTPVNPRRNTRFNVSYRYARGDPSAAPDLSFVYLFPWEHGTKTRVDQGYFGPSTHRNLRALDFGLAEGATICAAREGVVIATRDDSTVGGTAASYETTANFVDVLHADGTWATYAHLQYRGSLVKPGDRVAAGTPIGRCGHTGRASGPHLHFAVCRASWDSDGGETIPTSFLHLDGGAEAAQAGKTYYAVRPGGPPFDVKLGERMSDADFEGVTRPAPATGKVDVRPEKMDDKVFFWCVNGMDTAQEVTVSFDRLKGFTSSKRLPYVRKVPARTEVYLLSLSHKGASGATRYEIRYGWRPAKP